MSVIGLFILSAALLASLWAGKVTLLDAAIAFFVATVVIDLVAGVLALMKKWLALRTTEIMFTGMADGGMPDIIREQIDKAMRNQAMPKQK